MAHAKPRFQIRARARCRVPRCKIDAMTSDQLRAAIKDILDAPDWTLRIILTSGDFLFGDYMPDYVPLAKREQTPNEVHFPRHWPMPQDPREGTAIWLREFNIVFNSKYGSVHGSAWTIQLTPDAVVSIERLPWSKSLLSKGLKNIPNPYATLIETHNLSVARREGLVVRPYMECALAVDAVTSEGLEFESDELLYADYAYFERLSSLTLTAGVFGAGVDLQVGVHTIVWQALAASLPARLALPNNLKRHVGHLEAGPEDTTTEMEGEAWRVFFFTPAVPLFAPKMPVLCKTSGVSYPREFWPYIKSTLVLLGEERQIPFAYEEERWYRLITARAIGYVADSATA